MINKYLILSLLLVVAIGFVTLSMSLIRKDFQVLSTQKIADDIYAIRDHRLVNFFLIRDGVSNGIAIDAGESDVRNMDQVKEEITNIGFNTESIAHCLLTCDDFAHASGLLTLLRYATPRVGESEKSLIGGQITNTPPIAKRQKFLKFLSFSDPNNRKVVYLPLTNNQIVRFQKHSIRCVATPGHTAGSMAYVLDGKYLFSGDVIKIKNGLFEKEPAIFSWNKKQTKESYEKLRHLSNIEMILTAHYGFSTNVDSFFIKN